MAHKITMQRRGDRLECTSPVWADLLSEVAQGVDLNVSITQARSVRQNASYWGVLKFVIDHGPEWIGEKWPDKDHLSDALQLELGYTRKILLKNDLIVNVPEHKNFEKMAQAKFNKYFEAVQRLLGEWCGFDVLENYMIWLETR
jgi:hypothetical protein